MKDLNLRRLFQTERFLLGLTGFYPKLWTEYTFWYSLRGAFVLLIAVCQTFMLLLQMYLDRNNMSKLTETLLYFMTHFTFLWKMFNFHSNKRVYLQIERSLLIDELLMASDEQEVQLITDVMSVSNVVALAFRITCVVCVLFYGLVPYMDVGDKRPLPLNGSLPYDIEKYYLHTYLFQYTGLCISAYNNSSIDVLTWKLIALITAQLGILKRKLNAIDFENGDVESVKLSLKRCIWRHEKILEMARIVEETFSRGIFMQFFASVIVICVTGFQLLMVPFPSVVFVVLSSYLCAMATQVATYCWFGNDMIATSANIGDSLYISNWYECDIRVRKIILILLTRVQKPMVMRAGFIDLSLTTLTQIMRSSYSYFAVLRRLYSGK